MKSTSPDADQSGHSPTPSTHRILRQHVSLLMSTYDTLFDLTGKTAVVTGGTGTLGRAFCTALAAYGASVAVVDVDSEAAVGLADRLRAEQSVEALGMPCDVSDPEAVEGMVEEVADVLGPIDILHNNAATKLESLKAHYGPDTTFSLDEWREIMSVNLDGMFLVAREVGRHMIDEDTEGSIIQTASIYGMLGPDERIYEGSEYQGHQIRTPAVYSASKGGILALSKHLATTWAEHGIRVNTLVPGGVESGQNDDFQRMYGDRVPLGRMAERDELVGAVVYLASDASSYVTGQEIVVDGGLTAW